MTTARCMSVLELALLLAASTAVADTVLTADEVIHNWEVGLAGGDSVRLMLPRIERRTLSALDIYEVRVTDSCRVAELSARLPQLEVALASRQPIPPWSVGVREMDQRKLDRTCEAPAENAPGSIDSLAPNIHPALQDSVEYWERRGYADGSRATVLKSCLAAAGGCVSAPSGVMLGVGASGEGGPYKDQARLLGFAAAGGTACGALGCLGGSGLGAIRQREAPILTSDWVCQQAYSRGYKKGVASSYTTSLGVGAGVTALSFVIWMLLEWFNSSWTW